MIWTILLGLSLLGVTGVIHFLVLHRTREWLRATSLSSTGKLLIGLYAAAIAHLCEAGLYAIAFVAGTRLGLGGFKPPDLSSAEVYYFSLVNYTSLGLGDIFPTGHLRFLAGVESLNGFLLISCSAALIFVLMTDAETRL